MKGNRSQLKRALMRLDEKRVKLILPTERFFCCDCTQRVRAYHGRRNRLASDRWGADNGTDVVPTALGPAPCDRCLAPEA